jgi:asparagine synthase (glutamine-hydrolysing)
MSVLPTLVRHYGEPYADSSAVPTFYVAQLTRRNVTVALNGGGGDESFVGYTRYWASGVAERLMHTSGADLLTRVAMRLAPDSSNQKSILRKIHRFVAAARMPMGDRYSYWVGIVPQSVRQRLYQRDFLQQVKGEAVDPVKDLLRVFERLSPEERTLATDISSYLPFDLLVKVDITAMANSLEARSPFLDHEVMEFAARLPLSLKLRGRDAKYLPKKAFADLLPPENVHRPKMGFGVPVGEWFRGPLQGMLTDTVLSDTAIGRGYFNRSVLSEMVNDHVNRRVDHGAQLWALFMLELWHKEFITSGPQLHRTPDAAKVKRPTH